MHHRFALVPRSRRRAVLAVRQDEQSPDRAPAGHDLIQRLPGRQCLRLRLVHAAVRLNRRYSGEHQPARLQIRCTDPRETAAAQTTDSQGNHSEHWSHVR